MRQLFRQPWLGPLLAVVAVYVLFALLAPDTFTRSVNVLTMARQTVVVSIAAVGMTLVMIQGGIDLSVGSTVALTTVIVARMLDGGSGAWTAAAGGVALGACVGAINGLLVSGLGLLPFIVTLGSMSALRGVAKGLANEQKVDADPKGLESLMSLPGGQHGGFLLPTGVWIALGLALIFSAFIAYTRPGRHVVAVGSNVLTARLCGVPVGRVTVMVYVLAGALAGLAGVMEFSTLTVGDPTDSIGLELEVIAAVVIGGGSLSGGRGSIAGALLGALLLTEIKTGCTHVGLPNWVQEILTGGIILVAMALDKLRERRSG
ncbi:MAG: ABC transporter permease [Polyangiaceae bacterium]|nr:ABC transporter permease [Polyangiaceae bacterium]MCE7891221.1 ABC transporter permease [Sorangiineae bacterium PRO1]MCL4750743.1 ABC transporter permease [Myxococcales bacterium]